MINYLGVKMSNLNNFISFYELLNDKVDINPHVNNVYQKVVTVTHPKGKTVALFDEYDNFLSQEVIE